MVAGQLPLQLDALESDSWEPNAERPSDSTPNVALPMSGGALKAKRLFTFPYLYTPSMVPVHERTLPQSVPVRKVESLQAKKERLFRALTSRFQAVNNQRRHRLRPAPNLPNFHVAIRTPSR
ncbi:hypothetical protein RvY_15010 [Ramazzottius varieornatus]|uniref:Uncharacterized protein n=1 Tax=Ramazzottius varieornatus TaxID=947166 RepID=A0A1D1W0E9_RAMVA|nr:hypothetical protein RvY_15010 [Ramazzottius varieornatus]